MRALPLLATASLLALCTGCSSIMTSPVQTIQVTSRPSGALVRVDGIEQGRTPTSFEATRWQDHELTLSLRGWKTYHLTLTRRVNPWIAGNILNGFVVGVVVDASTGAIYKLDPPELAIDLDKAGVPRRSHSSHSDDHHSSASPAAKGGRVVVLTTAQPEKHWRKVGQMERM